MDANGTRFHLLLGRADWGACHDGQRRLGERWGASPPSDATDLHWDPDRHEVLLRPEILQFPAAPGDALDPDARRGAGRDRFGNWYWIADSRTEILVRSAGTAATTVFWPVDEPPPRADPGAFQPAAPPPPPRACLMGGLVVTDDHYLVVGTLAPAGLLVFDLFSGGPPRRLRWPASIPFSPFDMAAPPGGGVFILDRRNQRFWVLDRHFSVRRAALDIADFQPAAPGARPHYVAARSFPAGIALDAAVPLVESDPVAIEALPDGSALVLDGAAPFSTVRRYRGGRPLGPPVSLEVLRPFLAGDTQSIRIVGHDFAFVPAHEDDDGRAVPDLLYVAIAGGNQAFAFRIAQTSPPDGDLELAPELQYLPMRRWGAKALVAGDGGAHYDYGDGWIPLVAQARRRYATSATLYTSRPAAGAGPAAPAPFDGREPDCVWHRLFVEGCIPPECAVDVWSRAANDVAELASTPWMREPPLLRRPDGSEQPFVRVPAGVDDGVFELLFQRARGRFLELKLELRGNIGKTPRLRALRIHYPRFSYLERYLPAVYREDAVSASFLDRFLANLEAMLTPIEDRVAAAHILFDVRSAPPEALEWLANWFGAALDPAWDDARRRLFIRHAMTFYGQRGTLRGLLMALELALSPCPREDLFDAADGAGASPRERPASIRIVESFRMRRTPGAAFGNATDVTGIRAVPAGARWTPAAPREVLLDAWSALQSRSEDGFPLREPAGDAASRWRSFAQSTLGFVPAATDADEPLWAAFLARRHRTISTLRAAYGVVAAGYGDFNAVPLPTRLPDAPAAIVDWYQFEAVVLAVRRLAHHFTVLLPVPPGGRGDSAPEQQRKDLARRVVDLQKPAHTVFDIKFYWAMFRVGEARLGADTLLDQGSRSAALMGPLVLGQGALAEGYLPLTPAERAADRRVLGRSAYPGDRLGRRSTGEIK